MNQSFTLRHVAWLLLIAALSVAVMDAAERSGQWRTVRDKYLAAHQFCEFCGAKATQVHHKKPVGDYPELELEQSNIMAVCDHCHATMCHLDRHYDSWNPLIEEEAKLHRAMVEARPRTREEAEAFVKRFRKCFDSANYQVAP